jgi:hypothetical protein
MAEDQSTLCFTLACAVLTTQVQDPAGIAQINTLYAHIWNLKLTLEAGGSLVVSNIFLV